MWTSEKVLNAAGYDVLKKDTPTSGKWEGWRGSYQGPARLLEDWIVVLKPSCRFSDLQEVDAWVSRREPPTIVVRDSAYHLLNERERVSEALSGLPVVSASQLLRNAIARSVRTGSGAGSRADFGLQYFVEPSLHFPTDGSPDSAIRPLIRWILGERDREHNCAVLLAPGGMGKTTLAREFYRHLTVRFNDVMVPLLVTAEEWEERTEEEIDFEDLWTQSLLRRFPGAVLGSDQVEMCLATGAIRVIFDGLDELCAERPESFPADDALVRLMEIFEDGRILVTSRSRFWIENVSPAVRARILEIPLLPFSGEQRDAYLAQRFPEDPSAITRAEKIFARLIEATQSNARASDSVFEPGVDEGSAAVRLDALPYVVMLVGESAATKEKAIVKKFGDLLETTDPIGALFRLYFSRESERQKLALDDRAQMEFFETLVAEFWDDFSEEDVFLVALDIGLDLSEGDARKLIAHDLLAENGGRYFIKYDFAREYFGARGLREWLLGHASDQRAGRWLELCRSRAYGLVERSSRLIAASVADWREYFVKRWTHSSLSEDGQAGLIHLLVRLAAIEGGEVRADTTRVLLELIGSTEGSTFSNLSLGGSYAGLDVTGCTFWGCRFRDVGFVSWRFDDASLFKECRFEGELRVTNCEYFERALFESCSFSPAAKATVQLHSADRTQFPIDNYQVRAAVRNVLKRFRIGQVGFKTRKTEGVERSLKKMFPFWKDLLDVLEREGVIERTNSGSNEIFKVNDTASALVYLQNDNAVGSVRSVMRVLRDRLEGEYVQK